MALDSYLMQLMIIWPLIAAIFITLIATEDVTSKQTISRFFSLVGLVVFLRLFFAYRNLGFETSIVYAQTLMGVKFILAMDLNGYTIFLFGAAAVALALHTFQYHRKDPKTNIHEVAPFLLTFVLFVALASNDIELALPIISISHFIIYFMVGYGSKPRRGTAIFHTGVFIITCDALALVLLQADAFGHLAEPMNSVVKVACLAPGLTRMCLPVCAPFMKRLFLNIDGGESPLIVTFMQLSGFYILVLLCTTQNIPWGVTLFVGIVSAISALYAALLAISDDAILIPYYFLVIYSSLTTLVLFFKKGTFFALLALSLLLTSLFIFSFVTRFIESIKIDRIFTDRHAWFLYIGLLVGAPAFGIGFILWPCLYFLLKTSLISAPGFATNSWIFVGATWLVALSLFCYAAMIKARKTPLTERHIGTSFVASRVSMHYRLSPLVVALGSMLIPLLILPISTAELF